MAHTPMAPISGVAARLVALAALFIGVASEGFCNDKSTSCAYWAKNGECQGENAEHLSTLCPHSCGTCSILCNDTDVSCPSWAMAGNCKANPGFMLKACPTSCGLCTPKCVDSENDCPGWTTAGACSDNPSFMLQHCPVSCGVCRDECKDRHNDCPGWAAAGQCHSSERTTGLEPIHPPRGRTTGLQPTATWPTIPLPHARSTRSQPVQMRGSCSPCAPRRARFARLPSARIPMCGSPLPCSRLLCHSSVSLCSVPQATQCAIWGEKECTDNPGAVMRDCPKTCGVCTAVCTDKEEACQDWASKGECEKNPKSMLALCPQSCGTCHEVRPRRRRAHPHCQSPQPVPTARLVTPRHAAPPPASAA